MCENKETDPVGQDYLAQLDRLDNEQDVPHSPAGRVAGTPEDGNTVADSAEAAINEAGQTRHAESVVDEQTPAGSAAVATDEQKSAESAVAAEEQVPQASGAAASTALVAVDPEGLTQLMAEG